MSGTATGSALGGPGISKLSLADLKDVLRQGWADFRRAPQFGLFFSGFYVLCGLAMLWLDAGHFAWILLASLGFPLVAPFAAVGLYEVSRRIEAGEPLIWREILGVVWAERGRQIPWIGAIIVIFFLFWTFLAHMIFALFMGFSAMTNISTSWDAFLTSEGMTMMGAELVVGAVLAMVLFSITVVSLPMLLHREMDFVTGMITSVRSVRANPKVMLVWAVVIAGVTFLALLPWFLGLLVALPVMGHATWHLYRRTVQDA